MAKRLWQIHSWLGLVAGLGLLVIGLTGSLLVFAPELEAWAEPKALRVNAVGERLPLDTLLANAHRALKGYELTGWQIRSEAERHWADLLFLKPHGSDKRLLATLDPFSGALLSSPRSDEETLRGWLLRLHYTFFAGKIGELIAGVFAAMLCVLGVTGTWMYRDFWRSFFRLRWRASARIFFSDLHKTIGISTVAFHLILGFTGAYWNLQVMGRWSESDSQPKLTAHLYGEAISPERMIAESTKQLVGFRATFISFPNAPGDGITIWGTVPSKNPFRSIYGSTVVFDAQTGVFEERKDIREAGLWAQFVDMFAPLHFGTFGGLPVKILWCIGGLAPGLLAISGAIIWRQRSRRGGAPKASAGTSAAPAS